MVYTEVVEQVEGSVTAAPRQLGEGTDGKETRKNEQMKKHARK